ncbi:hypothetical protein [Streptomyces sp. W1SF4]|uniref:hypothetical protein n=1 Tax=Streptomyces sp. W1SF4 TaxID=2305220 RepID=UPI0013E09F83|nr:hypothetical protein [Streptomyces sp. W1SF4]
MSTKGAWRLGDRVAGLAKTQPAREFFFDDLDQPVKDGRATSGTGLCKPDAHDGLVRRMTSPQHQHELTRSLGVPDRWLALPF